MKSSTLKIMTYNVHSCIGRDGIVCPYRIAQVIAAYDPDVVALQELDEGRPRTNHVHQAREIAKHLNMDFHFHPCREIEEERFGNALLSKHPLKLIRAAALPGANGWRSESRGAIWARIIAGDRDLQIITTHFGHQRRERLAQAEAILGDEWISNALCKPPFILCGDFNTIPLSPVYRKFRSVLLDAQELYGENRKTYPSRYPIARIDHIFASSGLKVRDINVPRTDLTNSASDHLPLIAEIDIL